MTNSAVWDATASIANACSTTEAILGTEDPSLGRGSAGIALFLHYLLRQEYKKAWHSAASAYLDAAMAAVASLRFPPALHAGFAGVAWTATHLERENFDTPKIDLSDVDDALIEHLRQLDAGEVLDLVFGLVGYGTYFLERPPSAVVTLGLELVIDALEERAELSGEGTCWFTPSSQLSAQRVQLYPGGLYDLGMAHGIPGIITLLAAILQSGVSEARVRRILEAAVRWLLGRRLPQGAGSAFPYWTLRDKEYPPRMSRLAWCYGDPGVAVALLTAARVSRDTALYDLALSILVDASARPVTMTGVVDASLCHGSAGLAQIFRRVNRATHHDVFAEAADRWLASTLDYRQEPIGVAGFAYVHQENYDTPVVRLPERGLLAGAAGIGLALVSAISSAEPNWDRSLLLGFM